MADNSDNIRAKRKFSQNFLIDDFVIAQIIDIINPKQHDNIVEIGPGLGALTTPLLKSLDKLAAIEIDTSLVQHLERKHSGANLELHSGSALEFNYAKLGSPLRVIGNLPYNITTPLLFKLFEQSCITDMVFMVQLEVAKRLCAEPGSKAYGRLSVMAQFYCAIEQVLVVGSTAFRPQPKVTSAIVKLTPKQNKEIDVPYSALNTLVSRAFGQRRKTIANNLKGFIPITWLEELGISVKARAEDISLGDYIKLAHRLHTFKD